MSCTSDDLFVEIFEKGNDIHSFLNAIFGFLNRCTNFYDEDINVCEQIVIDYLRHWHPANNLTEVLQIENNHVIADCDMKNDSKMYIEEVMTESMSHQPNCFIDTAFCNDSNTKLSTSELIYDNEVEVSTNELETAFPDDKYTVTMSSDTKCKHNTSSESFNGAITEKYSWSQSINEVDVHINLPDGISSSGQLKVLITPCHLRVDIKAQSAPYIDEDFSWKCKPTESVWWLSNGKLLIHLQKKEDRWWQKLLESEAPIDVSKMQCSRPLDELPEDAQNLVQEMFWNEQQKMLGKPTADEIRKHELLRKSWNAEGSPFKGTEFDPSLVNFH